MNLTAATSDGKSLLEFKAEGEKPGNLLILIKAFGTMTIRKQTSVVEQLVNGKGKTAKTQLKIDRQQIDIIGIIIEDDANKKLDELPELKTVADQTSIKLSKCPTCPVTVNDKEITVHVMDDFYFRASMWDLENVKKTIVYNLKKKSQ